MIFYGLSSEQELFSHVRRACESINHNNVPDSIKFLLEIAAAETGMGSVRDVHFAQGKSVFQFDSVGFFDTQMRIINEHPKITKRIFDQFNIDIAKVPFSSLDYSPLLGAIFCRLKIYLIPHSVPKTRIKRAEMWKKYYNSAAGAGTIEHYMSMCDAHVGAEI